MEAEGGYVLTRPLPESWFVDLGGIDVAIGFARPAWRRAFARNV